MGRSLTNSLHNPGRGHVPRGAQAAGLFSGDLVEKERGSPATVVSTASPRASSTHGEQEPARVGMASSTSTACSPEIEVSSTKPDNENRQPVEIGAPESPTPSSFTATSPSTMCGRQTFKWESGERQTAVACDTRSELEHSEHHQHAPVVRQALTVRPGVLPHRGYVQATRERERRLSAPCSIRTIAPIRARSCGWPVLHGERHCRTSSVLPDDIRMSRSLLPEKVHAATQRPPDDWLRELVRLLMDEHGLQDGPSHGTSTRVFSFTNHTVLQRR